MHDASHERDVSVFCSTAYMFKANMAQSGVFTAKANASVGIEEIFISLTIIVCLILKFL